MLSSSAPLLLALDGNSLLHRAYHAAATGRLLDQDGRPVWALKGLVGYIARAAAQLRPQAVVVGFDCPAEESIRRADWPLYKAQRAPKPADLVAQLAEAPELLREVGLTTVIPTGYEADDVLASAAALARDSGWRCVVVTSDRDAFAVIDATTSVLRVRNGGLDRAVLVTLDSLIDVCGVHPWQYPEYAALRGDPSDNLRGVRGFGSATAARLLTAYGTLAAAWEALDGGLVHDVRAAIGRHASRHLGATAMRETVARNLRLMGLRADLPVPKLDSTRLPLDLLTMRRALAARGIILGPSLWALTGGVDPNAAEEAVPLWFLPRARPWTRSLRARRDPLPGQLALF